MLTPHWGLTLSYYPTSPLSVCLSVQLSNRKSQGFHVILYSLPVSASPSSRRVFSHLCQDASLAADKSWKVENWWEKTVRERKSRQGVKRGKMENGWVFSFPVNRNRPLEFGHCVVLYYVRTASFYTEIGSVMASHWDILSIFLLYLSLFEKIGSPHKKWQSSTYQK